MSNSVRYVMKQRLLIEIKNLREALAKSDEKLRKTGQNLIDMENSYINLKNKIQSITQKNLFLGLYSAFRLWMGERRQ